MSKNQESPNLEEMQEMVDKKANELTTKMGVNVMPLLFNHNDEWIVGYIKRPNRTVTGVVIDKMEKYGKYEAGNLLLQACLLKEESDNRIIDPSPSYDAINIGAALESLNTIEINMSVVKKNTRSIE